MGFSRGQNVCDFNVVGVRLLLTKALLVFLGEAVVSCRGWEEGVLSFDRRF